MGGLLLQIFQYWLVLRTIHFTLDGRKIKGSGICQSTPLIIFSGCVFFLFIALNRIFCLSLQIISLLTFSAKFPYNALGSEFTVGAWIGTGLAIIKTFLAITHLHLLAGYIGFTLRVITASHFLFLHALFSEKNNLLKTALIQ